MTRLAAALALLFLLSSVASAQRTVSLAITGSAATQNPTLADYEAGFVTDATPLTWTATVNGPRSNCSYVTTVRMRASSSTIGNGKSIADVSWSSGGAYTTLSTSYVTIGTVTLTSGTRTQSGALTFRILLDWAEESASYAGSALQFQVSTTTSGSGC